LDVFFDSDIERVTKHFCGYMDGACHLILSKPYWMTYIMNIDYDKKSVSPQELIEELSKLSCHSSRERIDALTTYVNLVLKWNRHMNLVGPRDWKRIVHELIVDSLYLAKFLPSLNIQLNDQILDIGSGAGIPGIPLRILWKTGQYVMIEPNEKRAVFLRVVLSHLRLDNTSVEAVHLQDLFPEHFTATLILSRGFLKWQDFLKSVRPLLQPQGSVLIFSNHPWEEHSDKTCPENWALTDQKMYTLVTNQIRYFWFFSPKNEPS
jgi:16S rRNA (guanine527-N7)-methyltransferase